ncbi:MAG: guanylate kinase [Oscillospiraceae bacterium]|nr:guanylate kinase [Oscillospiraceae bacterium]
MIDERKLVVVSGPSGCGKDTVVGCLMKMREDIFLSVSCTTRQRRANETDGVHYYFISRGEFQRRIEANRMLEYTEYAGNLYGTPLDELEQKLTGDHTVVLIIEVEGAKNVKRMFPGSMCVFIVPPSLEVLEQRLRLRCTESEEVIRTRLRIAEQELSQLDFYDVSIVNDVAEVCAAELSKAIDTWQNKQPEKGDENRCSNQQSQNS